MMEAQSARTLQLFYAGVLVDTVRQYADFGILDQATEKKRREQEIAAPGQIAQLGIRSPEELFSTFSSIFGCAVWSMEKEGGKLRAKAAGCLACAIAKKLGAPAPLFHVLRQPLRRAGEGSARAPPSRSRGDSLGREGLPVRAGENLAAQGPAVDCRPSLLAKTDRQRMDDAQAGTSIPK